MAEDSVTLKTSKLAQALPMPGRSMSLKWKIGAASGGTVLLMGILVLAVVYFLTGNALRNQVDFRSSAIATNLSDAAAPYMSRRSVLELDALVAKYGRLEGVAYAFIQDAKGEILASSAHPFPADLKSPLANARTDGSREVTLRGRPVRETRSPVSGRDAGSDSRPAPGPLWRFRCGGNRGAGRRGRAGP